MTSAEFKADAKLGAYVYVVLFLITFILTMVAQGSFQDMPLMFGTILIMWIGMYLTTVAARWVMYRW